MTKNYGLHIIVREFTKALLLEFAYRELVNLLLKGKEMTFAIFEPICKETHMGHGDKRQLETLPRST